MAKRRRNMLNGIVHPFPSSRFSLNGSLVKNWLMLNY
jgi:hypothetical protein